MLLSLLGICVLLGPFQGPEWEPARSLLADQDRSCRHPWCCGNLLVFCLFVIWQVRHCWRQFTGTRASRKAASKVSPRKWTVASRRPETCFRLTRETHFSPRKFRELEAHVQQWAQKKRRGHRQHLQESWPLYLLPWPAPCREALTSAAPLCHATSFPGTGTLPLDSVWASWQAPWTLSNNQIYKPLSPAVEMYGRTEHLLPHAQEELLSLEPVDNTRALATALPTLPSSQRLPICSREFLLAPSGRHGGVSSPELGSSYAEDQPPGRKHQAAGREDGQQIPAQWWLRQTESSQEDTRVTQQDVRDIQLLMGVRREHNAENHSLGGHSPSPGIRKPSRAGLAPDGVSQELVGAENWVTAEEPGDGGQRESGYWVTAEEPGDGSQRESGYETPEVQGAGVLAHRGENQGIRGETDAETLTSVQGVQDKSGNEGAADTNQRAAREGGRLDHAGGEPGGGNCAQIPGGPSTETLAGDWRSQEQAGGEEAAETWVSAGEGLGEVEKAGADPQARGWARQEGGSGAGPHTPAWGAQRAGQRRTSRAEIQRQLRWELQMWVSHGLRRDRKKKFQEVREEDWVVIQALWWADVTPAVGSTAKESRLAEGEHRGWTAAEHRAGTEAAERRGGSSEWGERVKPPSTEAGALGPFRRAARAPTRSLRRKIQAQSGVSSTGVEAPGERSSREAGRTNGGETQKPGEEAQAQPDRDPHGKIHSPRPETPDQVQDKDSASTQAPEAGNGEESPTEADGETHASEQEEGEKSPEVPAPEKSQVEDGGEEKREEEMQSQAGGERETEMEAPEQRHESEAGGEGAVAETLSTHLPGSDSAGSHPPGRRAGEQAEGERDGEKRRSESHSGAGRSPEGPAGPRTQLSSDTVGEMVWAEWPAQGDAGGENEVGSKGQRSLGRPSGDSETQTQGPGEVFKEESQSEIHGEMPAPGKGRQGPAGGPAAGGGEVETPKTSPHTEPSGGEVSPALSDSSHQVSGEEAKASTRCTETKPLAEPAQELARAQEELLASQSTTPGRKHQEAAAPTPGEAPSKPWRRLRRSKAVGEGKASSLTRCPSPDPPPRAEPSDLPSGTPRAVRAPRVPLEPRPLPPQGLFLKKSQQMLLESLLRRKRGHLRWGLPQRVLASHLLSSPAGPWPAPLAGMARPKLHGGCGHRGPQERPREAQNSKVGMKFSERTLKALSAEKKSLQPPPQGQGQAKPCTDLPLGPEMPGRARPAGVLREPRNVPEAAGAKAKLPESRSCHRPEMVPGPCREVGRSRNAVRPGTSQVAQSAPSRAAHSGSGPALRDAPEPPTSQRWLLTLRGRGSVPGPQPSAGATGAASFKGSLQCAAARLGTALRNKRTSSPCPARRQLSVPTPRLRHPDPSLLSHPNPPHSGEDGMCPYAGLAPPHTDVTRSQGALKKPKGAPRNPVTSRKSGLMKHLRYFLLQRGFRK